LSLPPFYWACRYKASKIGLNFQGRPASNDKSAPALPPTVSAGVVPQTHWNNFDNWTAGATVSSATDVPLNDDTGTATPVKISFTANDSWNDDAPLPTAASTGDQILTFGCIKQQGAGNDATFTYAGVPAGPTNYYDLYVYTTSNNDGVRLNTAVGTQKFYTIGEHTFSGTFKQATNTVDPQFGGFKADVGNYVKFSSVKPAADGTLLLTATYVSGGDGLGIAGLQLVSANAPAADTQAPLISSTSAGPDLKTFNIVFSEPVTAAAANPARFTLSGGVTVTAAAFVDGTDNREITVTTSPHANSTSYTVTLNGIKDLAGNTAVGTGTFTTVAAGQLVSEINGFDATWLLNTADTVGVPTISAGKLVLTTPVNSEARSAYFNGQVTNLHHFNVSFTYQSGGGADGAAFVLHNDPRGTAAIGGGGGALAVSGITPSAEVEFNLYSGNGGSGYAYHVDGAAGSYTSTLPLDVTINHPINVRISYDSASQSLTTKLLDTVAGTTFTRTETGVDLPTALGESAYIGFTGATGGVNSDQSVSNFKFTTKDIVDTNTVQITTQPKSVNAEPGGFANFSVGVNGFYNFQWFKGTTAIAGQTNAVLTIGPTTTADNNTQYHVVVTNPGNASTATSSTVTLKVGQITASGFVKREFFSGKSKADIEDPAFAGAPDFITYQTSFESPVNTANTFTERLSGFFVAPVSGDYVFFVCSDDNSDLFLSTDATPANKKLIAQESGWSASRQWITSAGASDLTAKRSDQFASSDWPTPNTITLVAGSKYYIEGVHNEGGGGDNFAVTYIMAGDTDPVDGSAPKLTGPLIQTTAPDLHATVTITSQPANATIQENRTGVLTVSATSTNDAGANPPISYQWQRQAPGGTTFSDISGATSSSYKTPVLSLAGDNGAKYRVVLSVLGGSSTSTAATVTVVPDTTPPQVLSAGALKTFGGITEVGLIFDDTITASSTTALSNYTLNNGAAVTAVRFVTNSSGLDVFQQGVILTVTGVTPGSTYNVIVKGIADAKGNVMSAPQTVTFTASKYSSIALGATINDTRDESIAVGTNGFNLVNGGNAFWNATDDITMVYEPVTGDFDKITQVEWNDPSSNWARAGISARESLNNGGITTDSAGDNPASRYQMIISDPATKFDGTAANDSYETNRRLNAGANTSNSGGGGPVAYPGSWVRLKRVGDLIEMYFSSNGLTWRSAGNTDFGDDTVTTDGPLASQLFVGPTLGIENGNITDTTKQGAYAARFRSYGDLPQKTKGSQALSVGLNFGSGAGEGGATLSAKDVAGVNQVAQANWNNLFGNTTSGDVATNAIVADQGGTAVATPITVSFDSPNTWASQGTRGEENNLMIGNDQVLMTGYLDTGGATTTHVGISKVPAAQAAAGYDVVVYTLGGVAGRGGAFRVLDDNGTVLSDYVRAQGPANPTNFVQAVPANATDWAVGNFIVFKNIKATNIVVEATTENGNGFSGTPRAPINAIQLVIPSGLIGGTTGTPSLSIVKAANGVTVTFEGKLQASDTVNGTYVDVAGAVSPANLPASGSARFFRAAK
jgi:hypothetical protein